MPKGKGYKMGHEPVKRKETSTSGLMETTNYKSGPRKNMRKATKTRVSKPSY